MATPTGEAARHVSPGGAASALAAAAALLLVGLRAPAEAREVRIVVTDTQAVQALRAEGLRLFGEGRFAEAEAALERARAEGADDLVVARALGIVLVEMGRDSDGMALLERVRDAAPADLDVRAYLGVGRYHRAEYDAAIEALESVLRVRPRHDVAGSYLGLARRALAVRMAESKVAAAEAAADRGDLGEAMHLLEAALAIDTGSVHAADRLRVLGARADRQRLEGAWASLETAFDARAAEGFVESGLAALRLEAAPTLAARTADALLRLAEEDLAAAGPDAALDRLGRLAPIEHLLGSRDRARASAARGRALAARGDAAEALSAFDEALAADPAAPVRVARWRAWARAHALLLALSTLVLVALLAAAWRRLPDEIAAARRRWRLAAAARAERSGDHAEAADRLAAHLAEAPADAAAAGRLAEALRRSGQRGRATDAFRRAIDLDPSRPSLRRALAETLLALDRKDEALAAYLGLLALPLPAAEEAADARAAAMIAAGLEEHATAAGLFGRALDRGAPRDPETLRAAARSLASAGRAEEANTVLKEILRRSPSAVGDVLREYRQIFRTAPGEDEIHLLLARHHFEIGEYPRAAAEFEAAAAVRPERWREAVEAHRLAGASERAVEAARRWAAAEPAARAPRHALIQALVRAGDGPGAAEAARAATALDPEDLEAFRLAQDVARTLRHAGRVDLARALLEAIVDATAFDATEIRLALGEIYAEAGDRDRAVETVQKIERGGAAIETRVKTFVASCYVGQGLAAVARKTISAIDLDRPGVTPEMRKEAWYWLGRAAEAEGNVEEAMRAYDLILQVDIRYRDAHRRREDLIRALAAGGGASGRPAACPGCGRENAAGRRFCAACGAPLAAACPACGASNESGARFCGACGGALGA